MWSTCSVDKTVSFRKTDWYGHGSVWEMFLTKI